MKVEALMTKDVYTCRTIDTLDRATELMCEHDIGSLPCGEAGRRCER